MLNSAPPSSPVNPSTPQTLKIPWRLAFDLYEALKWTGVEHDPRFRDAWLRNFRESEKNHDGRVYVPKQQAEQMFQLLDISDRLGWTQPPENEQNRFTAALLDLVDAMWDQFPENRLPKRSQGGAT
jgi:hypothetical protein